jgi:hypothetical protein
MHIPQCAIDDMKKVEGWEKFIDQDGAIVPNIMDFFKREYMEARQKGLQKIMGYDVINDEDGTREAHVRFEHDVWRIAGVPTPEELTLLKEESTGAVEQAFPYLMFGDYEDALLWRLRHF